MIYWKAVLKLTRPVMIKQRSARRDSDRRDLELLVTKITEVFKAATEEEALEYCADQFKDLQNFDLNLYSIDHREFYKLRDA